MKTPSLNRKNWEAAGQNPNAPVFAPHLWNDSVNGLDNYRNFTVKVLGVDFLENRDDFYDHLDYMSLRFGLYDDAANATLFDLPILTVRQWKEEFVAAFNTVQFSNNCYSYIWNDHSLKMPGAKPHIGYRLGTNANVRDLPDMMHILEQEGMRYHGKSLPPVKDGFYTAALFVKLDEARQVKDFHWLREDRTRSYSHKKGFDPIENRTKDGRSITHPELIVPKTYRFQGFLYTPAR